MMILLHQNIKGEDQSAYAKADKYLYYNNIEPRHEISNNVVCATSKGSDQPAHTPSRIRAFASPFNIL